MNKNIHNNWRKFLTEGTFKEERLLREVSEDEVEHIRKALDELGPEQLAFQHIFGEKNRLLIPFSTKDKKSPLGQFVDIFTKLGYDVDWNKGIITGEQTFSDSSPEALTNMLMSLMRGGPDDRNVRTKKVQMKIGKFFSKIDNLAKKVNKLIKEILDNNSDSVKANLQYSNRYMPGLMTMYESGEMFSQLTGKTIDSSLGDRAKDYYRALDQLKGLLGHDRKFVKQALKAEKPLAEVMGKYWQQNADFIKKNIDNLQVDTYSILITRHPIDVLRMSDFEDIQSCHSPRSRGGMGEYYKCAVAEAHGHGALAYVVNTNDLEEEFGTRDIAAINNSSAFQENQDVFYDELRDAGGEIEPVSRLRMRQVRYFENVNPKTDDEGVELAVPEKRVYGQDIPGFRKTLMNWLVGVQKANAEAVAKPNPNPDQPDQLLVNFKRMVKYGGSYEDNAAGDLVMNLFRKQFPGRNIEFYGDGYIDQNMETERELERELDFGGTAALRDAGERGMESVRQYLGDRLHEVSVDVENEDGGYAVPEIIIKFVYEGANISEEQYTAGRAVARYIPGEIGDYGRGYDIFIPGGTYQTRFFITAPGDPRAVFLAGYGASENDIFITLAINFEKFNEGVISFADPDNLESTMEDAAETVRSFYEGYEMIIRKILMREGILDGGAIDELGRDVDSGEYSSSDWDVETEEGDYEPNEYEMVTANLPCVLDYSKTTKDVAQRIVADRNFWIRIRTKILDAAREELTNDQGYQVDYDRFVDEVDDQAKQIEFRLNFHVGEGDKNEQVELFKLILEVWDSTDAVERMIQSEFDKFARAYNPENPQTISESQLRLRNRSREERMFDKWRRFLK
mgnify:CR=1 FL=1